MRTTLISHPDCENHRCDGHPERPERLRAIMTRLSDSGLSQELDMVPAIEVPLKNLTNVHPSPFVEQILSLNPSPDEPVWLDPDTYFGQGSLRAARLAAGSGVQAVDLILNNLADNVFCAVRPPGHHAELATAMGFCIFNNVAIAAEHALKNPAIEKVAILDFDVHHCNGTVDIYKDRNEVLVCSSFQHPFYPNRYYDFQNSHIVISPLQIGSGSYEFRSAIENHWIPAIEQHEPDLILVSAGFDAHRNDPVGGLNLLEDDYAWITRLIRQFADRYAENRLISTLEGGYDLGALADSVAIHLAELKS
jgi:acetoin utilization deacetylase AcuC-like enzyme